MTPRRLEQVVPAYTIHFQCQRGLRLSSQPLSFVQEILQSSVSFIYLFRKLYTGDPVAGPL